MADDDADAGFAAERKAITITGGGS